ncbi:hypothetical protein [Mycolicibacterium fluoranthenivorans]|uniref:Uncharacterized protein n=1 Tax=Mycolicibacterium fluoranthenivorans TaxID=258505 RepID=A0A7X5U595_9MYCO|nr:hypothetical protein [Mycolicibacterium fluoranthenivorans]MCV7354735.1 hypothetical protein [Mycolicibacterium fluoranthenivorans]NIH98675.1 hypothetical protein [Mycolicibacterium fluoranthenivorans]
MGTQLVAHREGCHGAAGWIVRVVLALLFWPADDQAAEQRLLERFIAPGFD